MATSSAAHSAALAGSSRKRYCSQVSGNGALSSAAGSPASVCPPARDAEAEERGELLAPPGEGWSSSASTAGLLLLQLARAAASLPLLPLRLRPTADGSLGVRPEDARPPLLSLLLWDPGWSRLAVQAVLALALPVRRPLLPAGLPSGGFSTLLLGEPLGKLQLPPLSRLLGEPQCTLAGLLLRAEMLFPGLLPAPREPRLLPRRRSMAACTHAAQAAACCVRATAATMGSTAPTSSTEKVRAIQQHWAAVGGVPSGVGRSGAPWATSASSALRAPFTKSQQAVLAGCRARRARAARISAVCTHSRCLRGSGSSSIRASNSRACRGSGEEDGVGGVGLWRHGRPKFGTTDWSQCPHLFKPCAWQPAAAPCKLLVWVLTGSKSDATHAALARPPLGAAQSSWQPPALRCRPAAAPAAAAVLPHRKPAGQPSSGRWSAAGQADCVAGRAVARQLPLRLQRAPAQPPPSAAGRACPAAPWAALSGLGVASGRHGNAGGCAEGQARLGFPGGAQQSRKGSGPAVWVS